MQESMSFQFNILVVEDEKDWIDILLDALKREFESSSQYTWDSVRTTPAASEQLSKRRYHFVSIDQNIPDKVGEVVNPLNGLTLCQRIVERKLLTQRIIYTAYGEKHYSNWVGKLEGTPYYEKSVTGDDDPQKGVYSAHGWASLIRSTIEKEFIPFALDQAGYYLPLSLSERARRAHSAYDTGAYESYIRLWIEIWESVLHLAFAQTLALCSNASVRMDNLPDGTLGNKEQILQKAWPRLHEANWMGPWLRYIGVGNRKTGAGVGRRFLQGASEPMRRLRNDISHSFTTDSWEEKSIECEESFLHLTDAIAFWIENPLLTNLQFHSTSRNRLAGNAIVGDQLPFPNWEGDAYGLDFLSGAEADCACLIWRREGEKPQVLILDPFIVLEREERTGRQHLLLLSHPARERELWLYRSLTDGRIKPRKLSSSQLQAITSVFGRYHARR